MILMNVLLKYKCWFSGIIKPGRWEKCSCLTLFKIENFEFKLRKNGTGKIRWWSWQWLWKDCVQTLFKRCAIIWNWQCKSSWFRCEWKRKLVPCFDAFVFLVFLLVHNPRQKKIHTETRQGYCSWFKCVNFS